MTLEQLGYAADRRKSWGGMVFSALFLTGTILIPFQESASAQETTPGVRASARGTLSQKKSSKPPQKRTRARPLKGLTESTLARGSGSEEFTQPLLFAPEDNGLKLASPQLKWLMYDKGNRININGLRIGSTAIAFNLDQWKRSETPWRFQGDSQEGEFVTNISFRWPSLLSRDGSVTLETLAGEVRWTTEVTKEQSEQWQNKIRVRNASYQKLLEKHRRTFWGITDIPNELRTTLSEGGPFRLCLNQKNSDLAQLKVCSSPFRIRVNGGALSAENARPVQRATVLVDNLDVGPRGIVNFRVGKTFTLRVNFASQSFIEISSQPIDLKLIDVVQTQDESEIILTGEGARPLGKLRMIRHPASHFWAATGVKKEPVWQLAMPREAPLVRVLGAFNMPFTMLFRFDMLPKESDRVFVKKSPSNGTYSSTPLVFGFSPLPVTVQSQESAASNTSPQRFEWTFAAPAQGSENRARLTVQSPNEERPWVTHQTLYRGYPFEASGRLTGVVTSSAQMVALGEIAASAWFESLFGMKNEILSHQRWGLTSRYFKALSSITLEENQVIDNFSAINMDLKYNILRGMWNRDELFGLILSYQRVDLTPLNANLLGGGVYWARTMPKIFDDFFNLFPLMEYPKYVDVEFIYYPMSMTSTTQPGASYSLNFHGKVFWGKRLYGEAGFGLKTFEFTDTAARSSASFSTAYGTAGLGLMF